MRSLATLACALLLTTAALAEPGHGPMRGPMRGPMGGPMGGPGMGGPGMGGPGMGGPMEHNLFPPELVLTNQVALGLSPEQVRSIKQQVLNTHSRVLDAQVDLHRVTEQLHAALESPKVDEAAVLSFASQAMDLEKQIKTAHLTLMIRVKNLLTPEQQEKVRALTPQRPMGPPPDDDRE